MATRREILKDSARLGLALSLPFAADALLADGPGGVEVNDVQSQLNATRVNRVVQPNTVEDIQSAFRAARREGRSISVAGGRHAMGGQQFGTDGVLLDMKQFRRVIRLDKEAGIVEAEAGIEWPELIDSLHREQAGIPAPWSIREKQTGVDHVSLGGSLAANIHGRGLRFPPIIADVDSFDLIDATGEVRTCSRRENPELFGLAIGGYGLFGVIARVRLRLVPRFKVQRVVEVIAVRDLLNRFDDRRREGFEFGDCQYSTDLETEARSHAGVFSCYRPVPPETPIRADQKQLSGADWAELYKLARTDRKQAFERYSKYYLGTSGQIYWSDTHQLAGDFQGYREGAQKQVGTEMLTEVYINREAFVPFLAQVREDFRQHQVDLTYGTIRFIEKDSESFLAWAKEPCLCIVCNLHVMPTDESKAKVAEDSRRIIDRTIQFGGRYYLTYHRWATRKQVETCYPQFVEFLRLKKKYDSQELFQSDWYRHYKQMFADSL